MFPVHRVLPAHCAVCASHRYAPWDARVTVTSITPPSAVGLLLPTPMIVDKGEAEWCSVWVAHTESIAQTRLAIAPRRHLPVQRCPSEYCPACTWQGADCMELPRIRMHVSYVTEVSVPPPLPPPLPPRPTATRSTLPPRCVL